MITVPSTIVVEATDESTVVFERPTRGRFPVADAIVMCEEILSSLYLHEQRCVVAYLQQKVAE